MHTAVRQEIPLPHSVERSRWRNREAITAAALVTAVVFVAHGPSLRGAFIWDDIHTVVENPALRDMSALWRSLRMDDWAGYGLAPRGLYRPLATLSLWLDARLWGARAAGYHLTALLLHAVGAVALGSLLRARGVRVSVAWGAAAVFAAHPLATEAVDWISARPDLLCGSLSLVALAALAQGRSVSGSIAAGISCFAKETGLPISVAFAVAAARAKRRGRAAAVTALGGAALYVAIRFGAAVPMTSTASGLLTFQGIVASLARWGGACSAFFAAVFWPIPLDATRRLPGPTAGGAILFLSAFIAAGAWGWRRRDGVLITLVLGVAGPLAMAAVYGVLLSERYLYLPLACTTALLATAAEPCARFVRAGTGRQAIAVSGAALLLASIAASRARASDWSDAQRLFTTAVEADPTNPEAWVMLGAEMYRRGDRAGAGAAFERAAREGGRSGGLWANLCAVRREAGELVGAADACERAVRTDPWNPRARYNRALLFLEAGECSRARADLNEALRLQPLYAPARDALRSLDSNRKP